jgi:hypothetical protein
MLGRDHAVRHSDAAESLQPPPACGRAGRGSWAASVAAAIHIYRNATALRKKTGKKSPGWRSHRLPGLCERPRRTPRSPGHGARGPPGSRRRHPVWPERTSD